MFDIDSLLARRHSTFPPTSSKPVVGITANYGEQTSKLADGYYKQVIAAGGTPVVLPPEADASVIASALDSIDALLLSGGADINPLFMGEEPSTGLGGINSERDLPELLMTREAYNRQMPILGICRGIQTLAVALGGKVAQDIRGTASVKHSQEADRSTPTHSVKIEEHSILHNIYESETTTPGAHNGSLFVNSFHHQAVSEPGPHLRVTATATDGIIEAVESTEHKPVVGVQWHPECMGADGLPLFRWLVSEAATYREVKRVHNSVLTLDTHCDTPMLFPQGIDFASRDDRILVDLHKMTEGRLDATIMVAYLPQNGWSRKADGGWTVLKDDLAPTPKAYADGIFDRIEQIAASHSAFLSVARTPEELWLNKQSGRKSIMLGIENGLALEGRLENIQHFAERGIVYITLCHNGDNDICDSAKGTETHGGVSAFGAEVIGAMNRLGIMVDMSHAHERSFYDALDISSKPIVCSHSSARALCDHPRNLTDDQMRALARKDGVCQITLYPGFLKVQPSEADIYDAMAHLDHAISIMGIDHVGLGTDFDGDGGVPGLANASELPNFTRELLHRRYGDEDIRKIWGGNFLRVMNANNGNISEAYRCSSGCMP